MNFKIHPNFHLNGRPVNSLSDLSLAFGDLTNEHLVFLQEFFDEQTFILARTSGSTGKPKEIQIAKQNLINSAQKTIEFFDLQPGTTALLNLSSDFIAGKLMWIRALTGGWHLDVVPPGNDSIARQLANNYYDFGAMVPLQVYQNLKYISHVKQLIVGGGAVSTDLQQKLYDLPNRIYATYGMTETLTHIAVKPLNKQAEKDFYQHENLRDTYRVFTGVKIATDKRNCLIIEAPDIAEKPVHTNDIVEIVDEKHFRWLGRYDNIINSGAVKLIPEQIEKKLSAYVHVPFFVTGIPDDKLGEKLVLIIEHKTYELPEFSQILHKYEVPKQVFFVDNFIRTDSGKIKRGETLKSLFS